MTERGLPIVDGAPACPFVAFDDDRDERATSPDHRHRCFAESPPAPRALAHQEAYCLSSAFPVCPTFQDWARREAARARPRDVLLGDDGRDDLPPLAADRPPRRPGQHTWAAPPPWLRGATPGGSPTGASATGPGAAAPAGGPGAGAPSTAAVAAAGAAQAGAGVAPGGSAASGAAHPEHGSAVHRPSAPSTAAAAGGLAGSFADRLASQDTPGSSPADAPAAWTDPDAWDDEVRASPPVASAPVASAPVAPAPVLGAPALAYAGAAAMPMSAGEPAMPSIDAMAPRRREHERSEAGRDHQDPDREHDAWAPAWERPRRLEAYPTLKSRRFPAMVLPPLLIGVAAVLIAAAALFVLPSLLGIGGGSPAGGASPSPSITASSAPAVSVAPTVVPAATPTAYLVQAGDTMSKIATKFHVPLAVLIAANHDTIPNPDVLKIGDPVIIPTATPSELPAASTAP